MPLTLDRIMDLVRKHDALGAEIARLDEQRAGLEAERAAVKDELEGKKPAKRAAAVRPVVMAAAAATPGSTSSAPASKPVKEGSKAERVAAELRELRPFYGELSDKMRKFVKLRAEGKPPEQIAKVLHATAQQVSATIYNATQKLRAARQAGGKPKSEKTPASDAEDEPGRAPLSTADLPGAPDVPAPAGPTSDVVHLWSPDSGGTPTCGLPYDAAIRMLTKLDAVTCLVCRAANAAREPGLETPRPPEWVLRWLMPDVRRAYQQVVLDGISMQTVAWFENVKATVISGRVNGARSQIHRLMRWEADREREGVPLTDKDREPPEKYSEAGDDPLLAILLGPGSSLGEVEPAPDEDAEATRAVHFDIPAQVYGPPPADLPRAASDVEKQEHAAPSRDLAARFEALRPFFADLGPRLREMVELRAKGTKPAAIAEQLGMGAASVSAMLNQARVYMETRRRRPPAPPPLPIDWSPPVDPAGRKPGEIDPEVDLSEFFPEDDEAAAPVEQPVDPHAELRALREYFPGLTPNQQAVAEATLEGTPDAKIADRQGASLYSVRTTRAMLIPRLRSLKAQIEARSRLIAPPPGVEDVAAGVPSIDRVRSKLRVLADGRIQGRTIPLADHLSRAEMTVGAELDYPADVERPRTRGDCADMPRPCPFVSCRHHLFLDVNDESGAIKLNFPHLEVDELPETCSLDVADRGEITLEEVAKLMNITRERVRQIEARGFDVAARNVRRRKIPIELPDDDEHESPMAAMQRAS